MIFHRYCVVVLFYWAALPAISPSPAAEIDYVRDIKPILKGHCYACHGALRQKSGLRLDTVASIRQGGDSGPAIVVGNARESVLVEVVTGEAGFRMPPEGEGEPLSKEEIARLRRWIDQGASGPNDEKPPIDPRRHWSFQPIRRPKVPSPRTSAWVRNPIDAFLAWRRQQQRLIPRPPAKKSILLRRLYLDLIGVPPTREQLHRFLQDSSPHAYELMVEKLLASPLYGQRWGRHWMDVWRYSDWYGRRGSNEIRYSQRHIWRWRDWIIESLCQDKGYDQMLVEMLAGDEVAPTDPKIVRATGFLGRNWYKFDRNTWLFETVEQTSKALLGLTFRCARCHDHKFDPVSQRDYYRFRAIFEPHSFRTDRLRPMAGFETDNGKLRVLADGLSRAYDANLQTPTYLLMRGDDRRPDKHDPLSPGVPATLDGNRPGDGDLPTAPIPLPVECSIPELGAVESARLIALADKAVEAAQTAVNKTLAKQTEIADKLQRRQRAAGRSESSWPLAAQRAMPPKPFLHDDYTHLDLDRWKIQSGVWKVTNGLLRQTKVGNFHTIVSKLDHPRNFQARVKYRTLAPGSFRSIGLSFDYAGQGQSQDVYTSINSATGQSAVQAFHRTGGRQVYPKKGIVPTKLQVGEVITLDIKVHESKLRIHVNGQLRLDYVMPTARRGGKFALWAHEAAAEFLELTITPAVETVEDLQQAAVAISRQANRQRKELAVAHAKRKVIKARLGAERARYGLEPPANYQQRAQAASRAEKTVLRATAEFELFVAAKDAKNRPALEQKLAQAQAALQVTDEKYTPFKPRHPRTSTGRRTALARWLTAPSNPRTARVAVNHIWLRHFGRPLVEPVDDFGLRSRKRTHPDLLDWLAAELIENNWSMKHLHRLIVNSQTYRLDSSSGPEGETNAAIDPDNRYLWRMNSRRMEAEVVRDSVLACGGRLSYEMGGPDIDENQGAASPRRSLYFRTTPDNQMEMLKLFDMASPNECYRRRTSVVPQQSLVMINSDLAQSQARRVAAGISAEVGQEFNEVIDSRFVTAAFEQVLSRHPTDQERSVCLRFLKHHTKLLANHSNLTEFSNGAKPSAPPAGKPHLRARENLVHMLFSHNDFVTIR